MPRIVQLLDPEGRRAAPTEWDAWVADVDAAQLAGWYRDMVVVRRLDTEATALQRQGELALWPPLLGQEAAQIGSARALRPDDFAFTSYREHAVAYCRGVDPVDLVRVWRGQTGSGWDPNSVGMATPQVVIGAQTLHATGWAYAARLDGSDAAAIAYFGDGAMSEGDVNEAFVFAASLGAPVVFFCQNNQWAISEPVRLQSPVELAERAGGFGIPAIRVDGNDVLGVAAVTRAALHRARTTGGPVFVEAVTYRMGPHTTADDPTRYRDSAELAEWQRRDPIARLRQHLETLGGDGRELEQRAADAADRAAAELRSGCIALPHPSAEMLFDHAYAEPNPRVVEQAEEYARYLAGFADVAAGGRVRAVDRGAGDRGARAADGEDAAGGVRR